MRQMEERGALGGNSGNDGGNGANGGGDEDKAVGRNFVKLYAHPNGQFYRVPVGYELGKTSVSNGFNLWCMGNARAGVPPLVSLEGKHVPRELGQQLSFWRTLYEDMEAKLTKEERELIRDTSKPLSASEVRRMYEKCKSVWEDAVVGCKRKDDM